MASLAVPADMRRAEGYGKGGNVAVRTIGSTDSNSTSALKRQWQFVVAEGEIAPDSTGVNFAITVGKNTPPVEVLVDGAAIAILPQPYAPRNSIPSAMESVNLTAGSAKREEARRPCKRRRA